MRKSNWVIAALVTVLAVFFVVLWYILGFNRIDAPLDLVLGIVLVLLVIIMIVVLSVQEKHRRKLLRAVYVAVPNAFNTEVGALPAMGADSLVDAAFDTLECISYTTSPVKAPKGFEPTFVIETDSFKCEDEDEGGQDGEQHKTRSERLREWKGSVRNVESDDAVSFDGMAELYKALGTYYQ